MCLNRARDKKCCKEKFESCICYALIVMKKKEYKVNNVNFLLVLLLLQLSRKLFGLLGVGGGGVRGRGRRGINTPAV